MSVSMKTKVRWGELDALGHVNNTVYFRWFEDVRIKFFEQVGIEWSGPSGLGPILAATNCSFRRALKYPADLEVNAWVSKIGGSSFVMEYQVCESQPLAVVADGQAVVVLVDHHTGKSQRIPDDLRGRLEEHVEVMSE